jgi:hypothetical protein
LAVSADKAYDSEKARQQIKDEGALPIIPSRSNATTALTMVRWQNNKVCCADP